MKVAELCRVELPNPDSSNYDSGSFGSFKMSWCRGQYNTNKALSDAVSQVVVGMTHFHLVNEAAWEEFGE